jgi:hypothetical protein
MGQVMKESGGKANPQAVMELLKNKLSWYIKMKNMFNPEGCMFPGKE